MIALTPHYVLSLEVSRTGDSGRWRFSLRTPDGREHLEVADVEPEARGERLELLTVVRALETLDQPSQVTLVGCSQYVRNGMRYGLPEWRSNGWRWEFFGQMLPVKSGDLWQRLDRALRFHRVECRQRRVDAPHPSATGPHHVEGRRVVGLYKVPDRRRGTRAVFARARQWIQYVRCSLNSSGGCVPPVVHIGLE